ncbi:MAG: hypothetical protein B7Y47_03860 [Sphingomonas sp. 28-63-12]|nr:MAG: hypothetical protein B7Y47_03860 [Sphingomonas sp. 28-63-12]
MVRAGFSTPDQRGLTDALHFPGMMIKALAVFTLILVATDYVVTGGNYSAATIASLLRFFHWLGDSAATSIFAR